MAEIIKIKANEYLMKEGDDSAEMFLVKSGTFAVYKRKGNEEVQIGLIREGELVGEMAFIDKGPRSASIKALSDSVVIHIPIETFEKTLKTMPRWFSLLFLTLTDRLRRANLKIRS
jgi:CRP-like cAMP-binding protein